MPAHVSTRLAASAAAVSRRRGVTQKQNRPRIAPRPVFVTKVCVMSGLLNTHPGAGRYIDPLGVFQEDQADDQRHYGDADRIPEAGINIAGRRHDCGCKQWQHAAEPAVTDMVW